MTQLSFRLKNPRRLPVDGIVDSRGVEFFGEAVEQFDGTWVAVAEVAGMLCLVEVKITRKQ